LYDTAISSIVMTFSMIFPHSCSASPTSSCFVGCSAHVLSWNG
jgi:hypothetical protein